MKVSISEIEEAVKEIEDFSSLEMEGRTLEESILRWSYLSDRLDELSAWSYINYTCETENEDFNKVFEFVIQSGEKTEPLFFKLKENFIKAMPEKYLEQKKYGFFTQIIKNEIDLFREENIALGIEDANFSKEYQKIMSGLSIEYKGKEYTFQQAGRFLEENDRNVRKEVWEKIYERFQKSSDEIGRIYTKLVLLRDKIAKNAGFENFRDYAHQAKKRFDYTPSDCFEFHSSIEKKVVPLVREFSEKRKQAMKLDSLKPYDLKTDELGRSPLCPFDNEKELVEKTLKILNSLDPEIGSVLQKMKEKGFLDLTSRKGKAPGGYNYGLPISGLAFIFMNAAGAEHDVITLLHESGHALHSYLTAGEKISAYRNPTMEAAELASMSMELITMDYWDVFYPDQEDLKRAKLGHLKDIIGILPWIAAVDAFQHEIYLNPSLSEKERLVVWENTIRRFSGGADWKGYEDYLKISWQRQTHILEVPFYYIEYGIAQLGALQIWKNYLENPQKALQNYKKALQLGYQKPMREIYESAGIRFDFSEKMISELMDFVKAFIKTLE
ncbi:MAG: hypothetical protein A2Y41_11630 [Spirochaetes bacterium GWB1_36_13]|nr:MAG: hypothetical protein A2Y41_11630 [Spirochaetes bacterium GWB1_36_13]